MSEAARVVHVGMETHRPIEVGVGRVGDGSAHACAYEGSHVHGRKNDAEEGGADALVSEDAYLRGVYSGR